jgi:hypothetical protein
MYWSEQKTDDDIEVTEEPDWNAPLDLGDGRCLIITTRELIQC